MAEKLEKPLFAQALGKEWEHVAPLVRAHYDLHPNTKEELIVEGRMAVYYPRPAILLLLFTRLIGGLVLLREKNIRVRVKNSSRQGTSAMYWHRTFFASGKRKPVIFASRMMYAGGNEMIEFVGAGERVNMGIRMSVRQSEGGIIYESIGYVLKLGSWHLPIPGHLLLGKALIFEKALNDHTISMGFTIRHPLWGEIYNYQGEFTQSLLTN